MIVSIDHVAVSSTDIDRDVAQLEAAGYVVRFLERGLPNPRIKRALMDCWPEKHDLALMTKPGQVSLEVIAYPTMRDAEGYIVPPIDSEGVVRLRCADVVAATAFWSHFGVAFQEARGSFRSPLGTCVFELEASAMSSCKLDDRGSPALAFVSTDAVAERATLQEAGVEVTPIERLEVAGKELSLFFAIGPSGELVEVLSMVRS